MNKWDYYDGDTDSGPYGYFKGFYVNWILNESNDIQFELKPDPNAKIITEQELAFRYVSKWLTEQLSYNNSHPLNQIRTAFLLL